MVKRTKTRKAKKQQVKSKVLSIPELRSAFEHIEHVAEKLKGHSKAQQVEAFQREWAATFGRDIDTKAVEAYLAVKHGAKKLKGKSRKQRGGGSFQVSQGAPLDYQTRPGIDGVHGQFPAYLDKGLIPYPEPGITQECGTKDFTATPLPSASSNQVGGASGQASFGEFTSALTFKPFESTVPSTFYQDIRSAYLGNPLPPSPAPEDHIWKYK
jgi:hypothetical protein